MAWLVWGSTLYTLQQPRFFAAKSDTREQVKGIRSKTFNLSFRTTRGSFTHETKRQQKRGCIRCMSGKMKSFWRSYFLVDMYWWRNYAILPTWGDDFVGFTAVNYLVYDVEVASQLISLPTACSIAWFQKQLLVKWPTFKKQAFGMAVFHQKVPGKGRISVYTLPGSPPPGHHLGWWVCELTTFSLMFFMCMALWAYNHPKG